MLLSIPFKTVYIDKPCSTSNRYLAKDDIGSQLLTWLDSPPPPSTAVSISQETSSSTSFKSYDQQNGNTSNLKDFDNIPKPATYMVLSNALQSHVTERNRGQIRPDLKPAECRNDFKRLSWLRSTLTRTVFSSRNAAHSECLRTSLVAANVTAVDITFSDSSSSTTDDAEAEEFVYDLSMEYHACLMELEARGFPTVDKEGAYLVPATPDPPASSQTEVKGGHGANGESNNYEDEGAKITPTSKRMVLEYLKFGWHSALFPVVLPSQRVGSASSLSCSVGTSGTGSEHFEETLSPSPAPQTDTLKQSHPIHKSYFEHWQRAPPLGRKPSVRYHPKSATFHSNIRYERCCVLFNIGSLDSFLALQEDLTVKEGLIKAVKRLNNAATVYSHLRTVVSTANVGDSFSHDTNGSGSYASVNGDSSTDGDIDLSIPALHMLEQLVLAQGQWCMYETAILRPKPMHQVCSKIAIGAAELYESTMRYMEEIPSSVSSASPMAKDERAMRTCWETYVRNMAVLFRARAAYHESVIAREKSKWALELARLGQAELFCFEALQYSHHHGSIPQERSLRASDGGGASSSLNSALFADEHQALRSEIEKLYRVATERKEEAEMDNPNFIPIEDLPAIRGQNIMPKRPPLDPKLYPQSLVSTIRGRMFRHVLSDRAKEILMAFYASMNDLIQRTNDLIRSETDLARSTLAQADLPQALAAYHNSSHEAVDTGKERLPPEMWYKIELIQEQSEVETLKTELWALKDTADFARATLNELVLQLDSDLEIDKLFRKQYPVFVGHSAESVQEPIRAHVSNCEGWLINAQKGDAVLLEMLHTFENDQKFKLLQCNKDQLEQLLSSSATLDDNEKGGVDGDSYEDTRIIRKPIDTSTLKCLLAEISTLIRDREVIMAEMQRAIQVYDIRAEFSELAATLQYSDDDDQEDLSRFVELAGEAKLSFNGYLLEIKKNVDRQAPLLEKTLSEYAIFTEKREIETFEGKSDHNCFHMLEDAIASVERVKRQLKEGRQFYAVVMNRLEQLKVQVSDISVRLTVERCDFEDREKVLEERRRQENEDARMALTFEQAENERDQSTKNDGAFAEAVARSLEEENLQRSPQNKLGVSGYVGESSMRELLQDNSHRQLSARGYHSTNGINSGNDMESLHAPLLSPPPPSGFRNVRDVVSHDRNLIQRPGASPYHVSSRDENAARNDYVTPHTPSMFSPGTGERPGAARPLPRHGMIRPDMTAQRSGTGSFYDRTTKQLNNHSDLGRRMPATDGFNDPTGPSRSTLFSSSYVDFNRPSLAPSGLDERPGPSRLPQSPIVYDDCSPNRRPISSSYNDPGRQFSPSSGFNEQHPQSRPTPPPGGYNDYSGSRPMPSSDEQGQYSGSFRHTIPTDEYNEPISFARPMARSAAGYNEHIMQNRFMQDSGSYNDRAAMVRSVLQSSSTYNDRGVSVRPMPPPIYNSHIGHDLSNQGRLMPTSSKHSNRQLSARAYPPAPSGYDDRSPLSRPLPAAGGYSGVSGQGRIPAALGLSNSNAGQTMEMTSSGGFDIRAEQARPRHAPSSLHVSPPESIERSGAPSVSSMGGGSMPYSRHGADVSLIASASPGASRESGDGLGHADNNNCANLTPYNAKNTFQASNVPPISGLPGVYHVSNFEQPPTVVNNDKLTSLIAMDFDPEKAYHVLQKYDNNFELALNELLV